MEPYNRQPPPDDADQHLSRLLLPTVETPWWISLRDNIRDLLEFNKLPPLQVTSQPVAVRDIWGDYRNGRVSAPMSVGIHLLVVTLLIVFGGAVAKKTGLDKAVTSLVMPTDIAPYEASKAPKPDKMGGGGGGGDRSIAPASKGKLPKFSTEQYTPPMAVVRAVDPKLEMDPTLLGPPDLKLPSPNMSVWGDPNGVNGPPSNGTGSGGGIGSGNGGGVGSGNGGGFGPGNGGGFGGGAFRVGGGVTPPVPIYRVEPEFTEAARKAKYQGTVLVQIVVDADGHVKDPRVVKAVGLGLDEKALEAVKQWKFKPGMKDGRPVPVYAQIEVTFRLL
jgi:TonB family protein